MFTNIILSNQRLPFGKQIWLENLSFWMKLSWFHDLDLDIYIYRLGIFRCLVRLKDQKLRFASTVSTHSPNMLWAWLAENGFCFFWDFRGGFPSPNPSWLWILILRQTSWSMLERAVLHLWIYCVYGGTLRTSQDVALVCLSTESQDGFWKFTHVDKRHACLPGNHADVPAPSH